MRSAAGLVLFACLLVAASPRRNKPNAPNIPTTELALFERKLDQRVERFDTSGRTLVTSVLDLAYTYELPTGLEYIDHEAVTRPINLELHNESVRGLLLATVQQVPGYQISFTDGIVDVYSPKSREDSSNLFNKIIKNFTIFQLDTHRADMELLCALGRDLAPSGACGGSVAVGQWGELKITVHLQNARVFEILNAIVSQNGKAVWTVIAPPDRLSEVPIGGLWHIYPLDPTYRDDVLRRVESLSP